MQLYVSQNVINVAPINFYVNTRTVVAFFLINTFFSCMYDHGYDFRYQFVEQPWMLIIVPRMCTNVFFVRPP